MSQPFIIYSLPRCRTYWLSEFLTYGDWKCHHEYAIYLRTVQDMADFFNRPNTGTVETAAAQGFYLINHYQPNIKSVVIRRPVQEAIDHMMAVDISAVGKYDPVKMKQVMNYGNRMLEKIATLPNVLVVQFQDLVKEDTCRAIFEYCLPYGFDREWWLELKDANLQIDVPAMLRYYHANIKDILGFKRACKLELYRLRRSGELHAND